MMAFDVLENGLRTADFQATVDVAMEAFSGTFKVQGMRDGNLYMTELPKRIRNKAIFREDNSSFSLGQNHRYYFVLSLDEKMLPELPVRLVSQAKAIARKVVRGYELDIPFDYFD
jgi:hypothetical protein